MLELETIMYIFINILILLIEFRIIIKIIVVIKITQKDLDKMNKYYLKRI